MSSNRSPSKQIARADRALLMTTMHTVKYGPYNPALNPFEQGTLRHARFERHWHVEHKSYQRNDAEMEHLFDVLGGRPISL